MISLSYDKVDRFITKLQRKGVKVRWEGWNIIFFHPHRKAALDQRGRRWGDEWGFETVVSPNEQGDWLVAHRLLRG